MAEENLTTNEREKPAENEAENLDKKENPVRGIRTFENDIAEYAKEKNFSVLDIAAEEAKVRGLSFENPEEGKSFPRLKKSIIVFFIALIAIGGGYFALVKPLFKKSYIANNFSQITEGPILTDQKIEIVADQGKREVFSRDIKNAINAEGTGGNLTEISTVKMAGGQKNSLTKDEFFYMINAKMPQGLQDYLEKDFMFLYFFRDGSYPILVFKSKSYAYVFSEMLKWENSLADDLKAVFPETSLIGNDSFADKYIQNHDARVAEKDGKINLAYSFIDRKYLVITNNAEALAETFRRFSSIQYANPRARW